MPSADTLKAWAPCLLAFGLMALAAPHTIDDAYISFHYAERFLEGEGLVFNPGERVEGFTNPSWTLLAALWGFVGLPYVWAAKLTGAAMVAWALFETVRFGQARGLELGAGAWLAASAFPLAAHAVMGLETSAYAALVWVASLRTLELEGVRDGGIPDVRVTAGLWFLAMWSRPETPLFFAWAALAVLARLGRRALSPDRITVFGGLLTGGVSLLLFRLAYYGEWLPNTYFAKTGGDILGIPGTGVDYLDAFAEAWWPWAPAVLLGALWAWREKALRAVVLCSLATLASWLAYVHHVGGDWMLQWRFMVPLFFPAAFVAGVLFERLWQRGGVARGAFALLVLGAVAQAGVQAQQGRADVERQIAEWAELLDPVVAWLDEQPPGSVAVGDIGWIAFHTKRPIVDVIGLIDKDIARSKGGYANKDKSVIAERVFEQRADYLIVMAPRDCWEPGYPALRALVLRERPELWRDYALVERFSLGGDGYNCVFARLPELHEPEWLERFDGPGRSSWELSGSMRVHEGTFEDLPELAVNGAGGGVLTTWKKGHGPGLKGQATSPVFAGGDHILRFSVAGGGGGGVAVKLLDATTGDTLRRVAGRGDLVMRSVHWDLRPFAGRQLRLRVIDQTRDEFGMLFVDDVALLRRKETAPREPGAP